jgi:hypothetical protein
MSKPKREFIKLDVASYKAAQVNYNQFREASDDLQSAIKSFDTELTEKELIKCVSILDTVTGIVYTRETQGTILPAGMNKLTFLRDMMNVDLTVLKPLIAKFQSLLAFKVEPVEEKYNVYATTISEIAKIKRLKEVRDQLNQMLAEGVLNNPHRTNQNTGSLFVVSSDAKLELK